MNRNIFNDVSKRIYAVLSENNCTVQESEDILRNLARIIRETSTVQYNESVNKYYG